MKKLLKIFIPCAAGLIMFSCTPENSLKKEDAEALMRVSKYEKAFIGRYGQINPAQDWGFGKAASKAKYDWDDEFAVPDLDDMTKEKLEALKALFSNPGDAVSHEVSWTDYFILNVYKGTPKNMNKLAWYDSQGNMHDVGNFNDNSRDLALVRNGASAKFSYKSDNHSYSTYKILEFEGDYYLGFDYEDNKIRPDGNYTDWILRIIPAEYRNASRVFVEDITVTDKSDFDFNDAVFDVAYDGDQTVVTVQAAGGSIRLFIEGREIHEMFGIGLDEMANTFYGHRTAYPPVMFRLDGRIAPEDIKVTVYDMELKAEPGKAPAKLCATPAYTWPFEAQNIDEMYPGFVASIADGSVWYDEE